MLWKFSLLFIAVVSRVYGYPYKLSCDRSMAPGAKIMGSPATIYNLRSVQVLRNGVMLNPGDQFQPGETLTVQVSTISSTTGLFKFMFEATGGAKFQTGNIICNGKREYNLGDGTMGQTSLLMPSTPNTQVNVWVAWATQFGHVYVSSNFTLINFPSTQHPSLSPDYKSISPTNKPTKVPTVKATNTNKVNPQFRFPNETQQSFTLVLERQSVLNTFGRSMITVNGTVPGPTLRIKKGRWVNIKIINKIKSEMSVIHWHGFDQRSTQWNDGPAGVTQCPINTMNNTKLLSNINAVTQLNYRFFADRSGTYWYHGHYHSQYPEGLYGAIVVEDDTETTAAYAALGATYSQETEIMIADFYMSNTETLLTSNYLLPSSNGLEPVPDYIVVNNMLSKTMQINAKRNQKIRLRVVNVAALSMYDVSVDGCPLTVIEIDGFAVQPKQFSTIRVDAGQRTSFILDWSLCDAKFTSSANIPLKVKSVKEMYRQYDQTDTTNWGLFGSTTKTKYVLTWVGQFVFPSTNDMSYYYYGASIPTSSDAPVPVEPNLLEMTPLFDHPAPPLDLVMDYNITFTTDTTDGVHKFFVNGASPRSVNLASPVLYDYMMPQGGPLREVDLPKNSKIVGDGKNPFVIPYNRSVTMTIRNGDGASHPIHTHGHNFWIIATSKYTPSTPIMRDVVSVPAQGWATIRFVSDNPGVWLTHCHIDWHMYNGFLATMIEAPSKLQNTISNVPSDHKAACEQYFAPTSTPTITPSTAPMSGTWKPTFLPTKQPSLVPTVNPSAAPVAQFVSNDPYASDWKTYGYDSMRRGYNPTETKIKTTTVNNLKRVWRYQLAGGAYMQPVIVLNYDFGNFPTTKYTRRSLAKSVVDVSANKLSEQAVNTLYTYSFIGCYGDKGFPRAFDQLLSNNVKSVFECFQLANQNNLKAFGIQYGGECWGSLTLTTATQYGQCGAQCTGENPQCTCTVKCASGENCGGGWSNSVFSIVSLQESSSTFTMLPQTALPTSTPTVPVAVSVSSTPTYSFIGCYGDKGFPRAFDQLLSNNVKSVFECFQLATRNNLKAFGIQYGGECWGSLTLTTATQYGQCGAQCTGANPQCTCTVKCASGENCGGGWSNSVFSIVSGTNAQSSPSVTPVSVKVTTATPSLTPVIVAPSSAALTVKYSYLGCYGDSWIRAMDIKLGNTGSVLGCYDLAVAGNYQYFGLQYGGECWASNNYNTATQYKVCGAGCTGANQQCVCTVKCTSGENCGGGWSNALFTTTQSSTSSSANGGANSQVIFLHPTTTPSKAPVVSTQATWSPTTVKYSYLGCYGDSWIRAMDINLGNTGSVLGCYNLAVAGNYQYFGLQYGGECWASNNYNTATQYKVCGAGCTGANQQCVCTMPCSVTGENCGGGWSNVLYAVGPSKYQLLSTSSPTLSPVTTKPTLPPNVNLGTSSPTSVPSVTTKIPFTYLGCYGDNGIRAMSYSFGMVNSIAQCYNLASSQKYKYFGLQYGGECWVSSSLASATQYGICGPGCTGGLRDCTCTMPCSLGDPSCGGPFANALYEAKIFTTIPVTVTTTPPMITPTVAPSTLVPSAPTLLPTFLPSTLPPTSPTSKPSSAPMLPPGSPTKTPTRNPTAAPVVTVIRANFTKSTIRSAAFIGDEKGVFHAVDIATGQAIWTTSLGYYYNPLCGDLTGQNWGITASPVFNRTVNTIYVVGGNGSFNALSMKTGRTLWKISNFYDKTALHGYGGLNEYNGIVYATLAGMCDQLLFKGGIFAVNTFTRSVQFYFSPSSNNPNVFTPSQYGGGVWGLSGITIGDPSVSGGSPNIYFTTGNCLGNNGLQENALYCESIIKTDINLKLMGEIKPPMSAVIGDNDYGSSTTYFNSRSELQTSGCKIPMIASIRKDFLFSVANADTMKVTQTLQIGARDRAQGIQQAVWDSYENLLIMTNQYQGTNQYAGSYPSGVLAFQLNATCGLNLKWNWVGNPSVSVMLVGPSGQRVALAQGGYGGAMLDVKTGTLLRNYNLGGAAASPPAFANGTMIFGCQDPSNGFAGQILEGWKCVGC